MRAMTSSQEWLSGFLHAHGGVAGTVHRVTAPDLMELDAAVNIPPPVVEATRKIPAGKGMAGEAMAEDRCVVTCNLPEDNKLPKGARAVGAGAGIAIPVHDAAGQVRAVVGIAFAHPRDFTDDDLRAMQRAAEALS
jgi:L-methionine (R)-S-oxide reductase